MDTVSLGLKPIFDVARTGALLVASGSAASFKTYYLEEFYDGLMQRFIPSPTQSAGIYAVFADQYIHWQTPPAPPTGLQFVLAGTAPQLQWQPGSTNTAGYLIQQELPGQSAFTSVTVVSGTSYTPSSVAVGTSFRVVASDFNQARFLAPFLSAPSATITYSGTVQPSQPIISLSSSQLNFSYNGGPSPPAQSVGITNAGAGTLSWSASSSVPWLAVLPVSGTAPSSISISVNPAGLASGIFTGTVAISSSGVSPQTITVILRVVAPATTISSVVNAANFRPGMVPGGLVTLFGRNLSPVTGIESPGGATSYKGVTVTVQGRPVPLLGVANVNSQEQISFQVPFDLATPATARVEINNNGVVAAMDNVPVLQAQPGIFEYIPQGSSVKYAAVTKVDGSIVGPNNAASREDLVSIFLTGMGVTLPLLQTGQVGPANPPAVTYLQPVVGIGGVGAPVLFSGYAPGFLGLYQINIVVPAGAPTGPAVNLDIIVGGAASQTSHLAVQ